jgi:hypothetical protein
MDSTSSATATTPGTPKVFERLLGYGADITAVDNDGKNTLHYPSDNTELEQDTIQQFLT